MRCGTCCKNGGPTLHREDAALVPNAIPWSALVTFRKGEFAYHPTLGRLIELPTDMIKIKGKNKGFTCIFFEIETNDCTIYTERPVECRTLACWAPEPVMEMFLKDLLERTMIFGHGPLKEIMDDYDTRFPPARLMQYLTEKNRAAIARMEEEDRAYRDRLINEGISKVNTLDLFLGRPVSMLRAAMETLFRDPCT